MLYLVEISKRKENVKTEVTITWMIAQRSFYFILLMR